jgi:hypothetical protein
MNEITIQLTDNEYKRLFQERPVNVLQKKEKFTDTNMRTGS